MTCSWWIEDGTLHGIVSSVIRLQKDQFLPCCSPSLPFSLSLSQSPHSARSMLLYCEYPCKKAHLTRNECLQSIASKTRVMPTAIWVRQEVSILWPAKTHMSKSILHQPSLEMTKDQANTLTAVLWERNYIQISDPQNLCDNSSCSKTLSIRIICYTEVSN